MKRIGIAVTIVLLLFCFVACNLQFQACIPDGGVWECSALHIVVDFSERNRCNATVEDGEETIQCVAGYFQGSNTFSIICQDPKTERYSMGEEIYCLKCVRLTSGVLTVVDRSTGTEYVFVLQQE